MNVKGALLLTSALVPAFLLGSCFAVAAPQGPTITSGQATVTQNGNRLDIRQTTDKVIIDWRSFSIAPGEIVQFYQLGAQSIALNRVTGSDISFLNGSLLANGSVFLVNPNGIVVGRNATINVGSFLATTSGINNSDFLAGRYLFTSAPDGSSVSNLGSITAAEGGYVVLSAAKVDNQGTIVARKGSIALGAAKGFTVDPVGDGLLVYQVGDATAQALATNSGSVSASGGRVQFSARSVDTVARDVINTTGLVEANSVSVKNGEVIFDGGAQGIVSVGGQVNAVGQNPGETGGTVKVLGNVVGVMDGAKVDASGQAGGGTVLVGGNWHGAGPEPNASVTYVAPTAKISADATGFGVGGQVVLWSDVTTRDYGTISVKGGPLGGDGGSVEVSSHGTLDFRGTVDRSSPHGKAGSLLLDPLDISIILAGSDANVSGSSPFTPSTTGSTLTDTTLLAALSGGNVTVTTVGTTGTANGDITISTPLSWSSNTLTLSAANNIKINANLSVSGTGGLSMTPGASGYDLTGTGASVTLTGSSTLSIGGHAYTLITTAANLQAMGTSGYYALANDIDVTAGGIANFVPISSFTGMFDGIGHNVSNLTLSYTTTTNTALIKTTSGSIKNTSFIAVSISGGISGYNNVGVISGTMTGGSIVNSSSSGTVSASGANQVGGLVGYITGGSIISSNSSATVNAGSGGYVGGLVGAVGGSGSISDSYATGGVSGGSYVGGLVGYNTSTIANSYATGTVTAGGTAGGLVGYSNLIISGSHSTSNVSLTSGVSGHIGGLVGENDTSGKIFTSYATGSVTSLSSASSIFMGGLVGKQYGLVLNSFATGAVSGSSGSGSYFGGLAGFSFSGTFQNSYSIGSVSTTGSASIGGLSTTGSFSGSYWDKDTSGISTGSSGTGLADAAMKTQSSYTGWDFTNTWTMGGSGYPILNASSYQLFVIPSAASKVYGAALPSFTDTIVGFKGSDTSSIVSGLTLSTTATASSNVGSYTISGSGASATSSDSTPYVISYLSGTLSVTAAALSVTANAASRNYGVANPTFSATYSGFVNGDTSSNLTTAPTFATTATTASAVGSYTITPSGAVDSNYSFTYHTGTLTVNTAPLTVTANSTSKTYGSTASFASTAFTTSGLVNSDTVTGVTETSTGSGATSVVGSYNIVPSAATGTGLSNYAITYANGSLTVNTAPLTVTANSTSKTYGSTASFASTAFTTSGLVNSDTVTGVTETSTGSGATSVVGSYNIVPSAATGTGLSNYAITYANGSLTVNTAPLTVTANSTSKTYGSTASFASTAFTTSGLVNSDTVTGVTETSTGSGATSVVGSYNIVPSTATGTGLSNYAITYANGSLTVNALQLTVAGITAANKAYDGILPTSIISYGTTLSSVVAGDTGNVTVSGNAAFATSGVGNGKTVNITGLALSGTKAGNYSLSSTTATASANITAVPLTITANNQTMSAGGALPGLTASYSGFVNGETSASLTTLPTLSAAGYSSAGSYPITASGAVDPNYAISYVSGTLTVSGATASQTTSIFSSIQQSNTTTAATSNPSTSTASISTSTLVAAAGGIGGAASAAPLSPRATQTFAETASILDAGPGASASVANVTPAATSPFSASTTVAGPSVRGSEPLETAGGGTGTPGGGRTVTSAAQEPSPPTTKEPPNKPVVVQLIPGLLKQVVPQPVESQQGVPGINNRYSVMGNKALW